MTGNTIPHGVPAAPRTLDRVRHYLFAQALIAGAARSLTRLGPDDSPLITPVNGSVSATAGAVRASYGTAEQDRAAQALDDLYLARVSGDRAALERFARDWGAAMPRLVAALDDLEPRLDARRRELASGDGTMSGMAALATVLRIAFVLSRLPEHARVQVLALVGFANAVGIAARIGASAALSFGLGAVFESLGWMAAVAGAAHPWLASFPDPRTVAVVAGSYLAYYAAIGLNAELNLRLLRAPRIGTSPAITATATWYVASLALPGRPLLRDWATRLGSVVWMAPQELAWASTMLVPVVGPSMVVGGNVAGALLNLGQAAIAIAVLRGRRAPLPAGDPALATELAAEEPALAGG